MSRHDITARLRTFLLATLGLGIAGTAAELLLLGHVESVQQLVPLVLIATVVLVLVWHLVAPQPGTVRALQTGMILFVFSGAVGIGLHFCVSKEEVARLERYVTIH